MPPRMPTVFVSHGAPSLLLERDATCRFLEELGRALPRPDAIVCISAHWESDRPRVTSGSRPGTIHDFYGFPAALYDVRYPAPGDPRLATTVVAMLTRAGFDAANDEERGFDHGAWVPLKLMYPSGEVPVLQVSVQTTAGPDHHLQIGRILQPLRDQGVLIIGSGGATHNLREFGKFAHDAPPAHYAMEFDLWLEGVILNADERALLDYRRVAPSAARNHPTAEHFLPLFVPLGAAGESVTGRRIHQGFTYGVLSMGAYAWGM